MHHIVEDKNASKKIYTKFIENKQDVFISKLNNNAATNCNIKNPLHGCDITPQASFEHAENLITGKATHLIKFIFLQIKSS